MLSSQAAQPEPISELIRRARFLRKLTQAEFGQLFNPPVAQPTVARWEKGGQVPDRRHFPTIAELLGCHLEDLFQFVEEALAPTSRDERLDAKPLIPSKLHLSVLDRGVTAWNRWREKNPNMIPNLAGAQSLSQDLNEINLVSADLRCADLSRASLSKARLTGADLSDANLSSANLNNADLRGAKLARATLLRTHLVLANLQGVDLSEANLKDATLSEANLRSANLTAADLTYADLRYAILTSTNLTRSVLHRCAVYGVSVWDIELEGATQFRLNICPHNIELIEVDSLELAQTQALIHAYRNGSKISELKVQIDSMFD